MWTAGTGCKSGTDGGKIIQLHALVDFHRSRTERFSCSCRGTNILTAIALDTGIRIQQPRPRQIFELLCANLLIFCLQVYLHQWQNTRSFSASKEVFGRSHKDVDVFGVWKISEKNQYASQSSPIAKD